MFLFSYTAAIFAMAFLAFAAFLLAKKRNDILARYLACYAIGVAVWSGSNAAADVAWNDLTARLWSGLAVIGVAVFCGFHLCFVHAFVHGKKPGIARTTVFFLPAAIIAAGAFTRYSIVETRFPAVSPAEMVPGPLYSLVSAYLIASLAYGAIRLFVFYRHQATPQQKLQIRYVETGFLILFVSSMTFCHILPLFGEIRFYTVGPQFSVFLLAFSGYAILKHQMINFRAAIQHGLIYSTLLAAIILTYIGILTAVSTLTERVTGVSYAFVSVLTAIAGAFGIPPIERFFRKNTDRFFLRNRYSYPEANNSLSRILNENLDMDDLTGGIENALREIFRVERVNIHILTEPLPYPDRPIGLTADTCRQAFGTCPVDVPPNGMVVPIILEGQAIAVVSLGGKTSGEPYFDEDTVLLQGFSYQAAIAIEKARLYRQTQEHSRLLERRVRERTRDLEELQQAQAQMICDISHNLQTPLTVIKGQLEMMRKHGVSENGLKHADEMADRISHFITRLLRLAALNVPEGLNRERLDLSELLREIISYFQVVAAAQGIDIRSDIADNVSILGDRRRIEEVILNILGNAANYIDNDRRVTISLAPQDGRAVIRVTDTGIGIPEEDIGKVFRRFFRGNSGDRKGTGLGLAICRRIVDLHGGTIGIQSRIGLGTTVTISIPLDPFGNVTKPT
ncbi:hypothetical protein JW899_03425 [Candidatus Uhrbacteria bacterium]|nr:hypothetical protein [Candidatus Uhrbacteria bacterium]